MRNLSFLMLLLLVGLSSCKEQDKEKARKRANLISNEPVKFGERLYVRVEELNYDYSYRLQKPDGTWKDVSSYETQSARASDAGLYTLKVLKVDSTEFTRSLYVDVLPANFSCSPKINSMAWPSKFNFNFSEVIQGVEAGTYYVRGKSSKGYLTILFDHPDKPSKDATYMSSFYVSDGSEGEALAYITDNSGPFAGQIYYVDQKQYIHVRKTANGKMAVILCDALPMGGQSFEQIEARLEF